jgi:hypothetical protein
MRSLAIASLLCTIPGVLTYGANGVYTPPTNASQANEMLAIQEQKVQEAQTPYCPITYGAWSHPVRDAYWDTQGTSQIQNVTIPVWVWGSWDDLFVNGSQSDYLTFGSSNKMFSMGYTSHAGDSTAGAFFQVPQMLRWFDYWLKGINNGIVQDLQSGRFQYQTWEEWKPKQASNYPIPGTKYTPYYLSAVPPDNSLANGTLAAKAPGSADSGSTSYAYSPVSGAVAGGPFSGFARLHNQSNPSNRDALAYYDPGGRGDQRLDADGRVAYLSAPLAKDTEVTGPITMTLYASTTAGDTDFVPKLLDIWPDNGSPSQSSPLSGYWTEVTPGYLKGCFGSYQTDYRSCTPIPTGQVVKYQIEIWPTSWMFRAGHRIGISIASSDALAAGPSADPSQVTIYSGSPYPSEVTLPIIPKGTVQYVTNCYHDKADCPGH